jgi:hypothetical protein
MPWIYALELAALILCAYRLERAISRIGDELYRLRGGHPEADRVDAKGQPSQAEIHGG